METTTHYADSSGVSIAYQVHGDGPLALIFVPGFVSHVELIWTEPTVAAFFRRLASFARLVVFDKRGQGLSDRLPPALCRPPPRLRQARPGAVRSARPAADARGLDGRPAGGDGRRRLRAAGD